MRKWVNVGDDGIIIGAFESDIEQQHAQELFFDADMGALVGKIFVDGNTVNDNVEADAYAWRIDQLYQTDWIASVIDHPQYEAYMAYRQALRDWPSTADFPDTKPVLGS
jgi:hypothetical protein